MKKVTHHRMEFNPNSNTGRIQITLEGDSNIRTIPINSSVEFICVSLILHSGGAYLDGNGTLSCNS